MKPSNGSPEVEAQKQVGEALEERDRIVEQARHDVRNAEQRFNRRSPQIHEGQSAVDRCRRR